MRPRMMISAAVGAIVLGAGLLVPSAMAELKKETSTPAAHTQASDPPSPSPIPSPSPSPKTPTLAARPVVVKVNGFFSWALLDRPTGEIAGSENISATNSTESMIKVWLVSDYLRRLGSKAPTATRLKQATAAIVNSDDNAAQSLYVAGGGDAVVKRMIKWCGLTDTRVYRGWWSRTQISARDAVRMGYCIADGTAAGPKWTDWVLKTMTEVRGSTSPANQGATSGGGRWGIIDGLPQAIIRQGVSIKNGWTLIGADGKWHVNCLAIGKGWVLAVLLRYPGSKGLKYGASICQSVAKQLVVPGTDQRDRHLPPIRGTELSPGPLPRSR
jgi:hypothetical protein